ncbi:MAG: copper chaperone PCu(A)C [Gammaproteobacteria bacterium]|nr:copper chaperone PCu(A)C [Gammaproteobacteria bacterium]NIT40702.1 copper chaperone PCu(A)C [Gammaproteobacteria bacterium]NIX16895.1 copper chaperone PCu(A)C [Gammaproteobacteria bacterium]
MRYVASFFILMSLFAPAAVFADPAIGVTSAWISEAPPMLKVHAGYLVIENHADDDVILLSASSNAYERIEFHFSDIIDGMASMKIQESITIPAGTRFEFSPGGYHLMLINNHNPLRAGDHVSVSLEFNRKITIDINMTVRKPGNYQQQQQHHHHKH